MATDTLRYDHPTYLARHQVPVPVPAVAASTTAFRFLALAKMRVKSVNAIVRVAGTNAAAGWDLLNGTTSVAAITAGTNTASTVLTAVSTDIDVTAGSYLEIKTKANSATLTGDFYIEYEILPDGAVTV